MKLFYLIQKKAWFVEHERAWFRLQGPEQVDLAVSVLPLVVMDQSNMIEQPHQAGTVECALNGETCMDFSFHAHDGTEPLFERIEINAEMMSQVSWLRYPYEDGWVPTECTLQLENVTQVALKAWLPENSESGDKTLIICRKDDNSERRVKLKRGAQTDFNLLDAPVLDSVQVQLKCPEESINSGDVRKLGFVLVDQTMAVA